MSELFKLLSITMLGLLAMWSAVFGAWEVVPDFFQHLRSSLSESGVSSKSGRLRSVFPAPSACASGESARCHRKSERRVWKFPKLGRTGEMG